MPAIARCTAQRYGGTFCDAETIDGSPFPICFHHAMQVHRYFTDAIREAVPAPSTRLRPGADSGEVVYYLEWAKGRVKIGYSGSLRSRMQTLAIPPDQILAVEPGTRALEAARHRQFRADRVTSSMELFHISGALAEHIRRVQTEHAALIAALRGVAT